MSEQTPYVEFIDMRLNDPNLAANDGRPRRVEPGTYDFEVREVSFGTSQSGNPTLVVNFNVLSEGLMKGRGMRQSYPIQPDNQFARERMKALIDACGVPQDEMGRFSPQALVGCRITGEVIPNNYEAVGANGQKETRTSSKLVGERPMTGAVAQAAPQPAAQQPARPVVARRTSTPAAPPPQQPQGGNGAGRVTR